MYGHLKKYMCIVYLEMLNIKQYWANFYFEAHFQTKPVNLHFDVQHIKIATGNSYGAKVCLA